MGRHVKEKVIWLVTWLEMCAGGGGVNMAINVVYMVVTTGY